MPELLLELLSEEIPARMQARAADDLKRLVCDGLQAAGLSFAKAEAFATPRRLALVVNGIPAKQPDVNEERRGPRADAPAQAIDGFKRSLPKGATVELRDTEMIIEGRANEESAAPKYNLYVPSATSSAPDRGDLARFYYLKMGGNQYLKVTLQPMTP